MRNLEEALAFRNSFRVYPEKQPFSWTAVEITTALLGRDLTGARSWCGRR
jgi:hypothetical protein